MANKKHKKKAQQNKPQMAPASQASTAKSSREDAKAEKKNLAAERKKAEAEAKAKAAKAKEKAKKNAKPGIFTRVKNYFASVRTEMRRVTWPSKKDLVNFSVAVCVSLVVVGIAIAALDFIIGEGLFFVSGLRS
ncbi:preprotein translocase subunit SecE [Enorma phocaeensis]|uniref:Protein translocase subunit SecE n=1 Tax=Enorma phocaeensis TaxID=1871019 RepID=A0A921IV97_9ACTN|nr:preprotein translocase subunit SecE [Enorma phocaeensis]HJG36764.1 preprotein translocase subunit SecE [Enorma phocaeensis]